MSATVSAGFMHRTFSVYMVGHIDEEIAPKVSPDAKVETTSDGVRITYKDGSTKDIETVKDRSGHVTEKKVTHREKNGCVTWHTLREEHTALGSMGGWLAGLGVCQAPKPNLRYTLCSLPPEHPGVHDPKIRRDANILIANGEARVISCINETNAVVITEPLSSFKGYLANREDAIREALAKPPGA